MASQTPARPVPEPGDLLTRLTAPDQSPFQEIWRERFRWLTPYYLSAGPLALALNLSYEKVGITGLLAPGRAAHLLDVGHGPNAGVAPFLGLGDQQECVVSRPSGVDGRLGLLGLQGDGNDHVR